MAAPVPIPFPVSGGTIYMLNSLTGEISTTFVPIAAGGLTRYLLFTLASMDSGIPLPAVPAGGSMGITRSAGLSFVLTGEATSASAKTDKAFWDFNLPDTYVPGANINFAINCAASGGTITAASTTMTLTAYAESNLGVETALTVTAAQQIPAVSTNLIFTITGTGLVPGQRMGIELTMLVTTSAGAGTGTVYSVSYVA